MIDLYQFLVAFGLPENRAVKMYRHVDSSGISIRKLMEDGLIDIFQSVQGSRQLGDDLVIFFAGEAGRRSRFIGVREVLSAYPSDQAVSKEAEQAREKGYLGERAIWHELELVDGFESLVDRLTINWPPDGRHHLWLKHPEKPPLVLPVFSLRPLGFDRQFPGFDDLLLTYTDLKILDEQGDGETGWITALKSTRGVYLITNIETGDLYVGSAAGQHSFWGRWQTYARTVHGGNKLLRLAVSEDQDLAGKLQYSVLETISNLATERDGLEAERRWKRKLGKKATVLNAN